MSSMMRSRRCKICDASYTVILSDLHQLRIAGVAYGLDHE